MRIRCSAPANRPMKTLVRSNSSKQMPKRILDSDESGSWVAAARPATKPLLSSSCAWWPFELSSGADSKPFNERSFSALTYLWPHLHRWRLLVPPLLICNPGGSEMTVEITTDGRESGPDSHAGVR